MGGKSGAKMKKKAKPPTVLLVEDTEDNRFMMRRLLEMTGYRVVEAMNGDTQRAATDAVSAASISASVAQT